MSGLGPVNKVWADYLPPPKNKFVIKVNGDDYFRLPKEEEDFDPSKVEVLEVNLIELNGVSAFNERRIPWFLDQI